MPKIQQIDWSKMPTVPKQTGYSNDYENSPGTIKRNKMLRAKQKQTIAKLKEADRFKREGNLTTVSLYALELEDGCYYIGMTYNVGMRFKKHLKGKGAGWTKLHVPISIIETRITTFYYQEEASRLEDDMTLEYAMKYGSDKVRGGGYCQTKPKWPLVITENERIEL